MLKMAESGTTAPLRLDAARARELAERFGTPLYVLSESVLRDRIRHYQESFRTAYPRSEISYASKANSTLAVLAIAAQEGCAIDVASEGEFRAALAAGVRPERCHFHGNNKQPREIEFAIEQGVGQIIVDSFPEIETISRLLNVRRDDTRLVLRLAPGVDPKTHAKISTGQADTKFGFNIADGSAERALLRCIELDLPVIGFHCHVGSQLVDPEAQRAGGEFLAEFAVRMAAQHGFRAELLNVGGGLGVRYRDENPMPIASYNRLVAQAVQEGIRGSGLDPILVQEPGRALVAEAGVTLYRVGVRKTVPIGGGATRTYLAVDGGLSDNPRPALYGARYQVERVARAQSTPADWQYAADGPGALNAAPPDAVFHVSGKHCETDLLFPDTQLPEDTGPGDLLQVLATGAYNSSMANNYNRYPRPATVLLRGSSDPVLVQRRETWDEMFVREHLPEDLI